ncbi:hypothetical protein IGI37_003264 [Enterococcus sp. AZ194]|uniref:DUF7006 family protein n=1 Tax=Enterococcus sp. AZ194 TaxID=2774629 RepID=UPI003F210401
MELTHSDYLKHFKMIYEDDHFQQRYPKLSKKIDEICESIEVTIQEVASHNMFWSIGKLQGYDARLQILLELKGKLAEEKVIEIAEMSYETYAKEQFGYKLNEETPISIYMIAQ